MGFLKDLFLSSESKKRRCHIKNLVLIAAADGHIDKAEFDFLLHVANRLYMPVNEFTDVIRNINDPSFYPPTSDYERLDQLTDLVNMMLIDGNIDDNEVFVCQSFALKLGFKPIIIQKIVDATIHAVIHKMTRDEILRRGLTTLR